MKKVVFLIAVVFSLAVTAMTMVSCGTKNQSQVQTQDSIAVDSASVDSASLDTASIDTFKMKSL